MVIDRHGGLSERLRRLGAQVVPATSFNDALGLAKVAEFDALAYHIDDGDLGAPALVAAQRDRERAQGSSPLPAIAILMASATQYAPVTGFDSCCPPGADDALLVNTVFQACGT